MNKRTHVIYNDNGHLIFVVVVVVVAEMYVNVVLVIRCLYSAVSLNLVKE